MAEEGNIGKVIDKLGAVTDVIKGSNKTLSKITKDNIKFVRAEEEKRKKDAEDALEASREKDLKLFMSLEKLQKKNLSGKFGGIEGEKRKLKGMEGADPEKIKAQQEKIKDMEKKELELIEQVKLSGQELAKEEQLFKEDKGKSPEKLTLDGIDRQIELQEKDMKDRKRTRKDERDLRRLQKRKFQQELKMASPAERAEMIKDQAAKDKKMLTTLQRIGLRLKGEKGDKEKGDSMFTGPLKFLKGILLKGALLAFLLFLPKILDSKFMRDAIDFLQKTVIPQLKKFYEDAIIPLFNFFIEDIIPVLMKVGKFLFEEVLPIITVLLVKQIEIIKNFFSDIVAAFEKIFSGDILGGIMDLILGIGDAIFETIDNLVTAVFNVIASMFGLEGTDSVFGSIAGFFTGIYDSVTAAIGNALTFVKEKVDNFLQPIRDFFSSIGDFFVGLLDFDIRGFASKFLPKTAVDFLLGKDEEEAAGLAAAEESGFYTKRGALRDSKIDQSLVPFAPENQLRAILADDDLADEDKQMIEKELQKRQLQKDLRKGGLGVPEQIDDFGGTDRAIREAAEREAASTNIVAPDQRVVSNSSTTVVQSETITPSYSGYSMISTESDYG